MEKINDIKYFIDINDDDISKVIVEARMLRVQGTTIETLLAFSIKKYSFNLVFLRDM